MSNASGRFQSSDGLMSSSDPKAVALWEEIGARMQGEQAGAREALRALGVKLAHPDDGWVKRDASGGGSFSLSWYALFDDRPEAGDLVAFGYPYPTEHTIIEQDGDGNPRASSGYRIVRVKKVERRHGIIGYHQSFEFDPTGLTYPPIPPPQAVVEARVAGHPMTAEGLTEAEREALTWAVAEEGCIHTGDVDPTATTGCRDCQRIADLGVLPAVERILADRLAPVEAERDALRERVEALADGWNDVPDHTPSAYDQGRVDQRHMMTMELLAALDADRSTDPSAGSERA